MEVFEREQRVLQSEENTSYQKKRKKNKKKKKKKKKTENIKISRIVSLFV